MKNLNKENLSFLAGGILLGLVISGGIVKIKEIVINKRVKDFADSIEENVDKIIKEE